jgi:hypothetical protein
VAGEPWPLRVPGPEAYFSLYAKPDYSWELERLNAEFERTGKTADLAQLVTMIELVLDEQGIDHTPCVPFDDEDV